MEEQGPQRGYLTCKAASKFCLFYFTFLLLLTLIFSAVSCEPMTPQQKTWWWVFIVSLIFSMSVFMMALAVLLYTDNYAPAGQPGYDKMADQYETSRAMAVNDPSRTQSYKTILTINSMPNIEMPPSEPPQTSKNPADTFMNLTPQPTAVTVVDMPAINAKRKLQSEVDVVDATPAASTTGASPPTGDKGKRRKRSKEKGKRKPSS